MSAIKTNFFAHFPHKQILITGGTGFIGADLVKQLLDASHSVTVLTRDLSGATLRLGARPRCINSLDEIDSAESFDAIINLAGAPVVGPRWTKNRKKILLDSRVNTTKALIQCVARLEQKPAVWIQASAIGYYGVRSPEERLTEKSEPGQGFMSELCVAWEKQAEKVKSYGVRLVTLRFGLVFGPGGALPMLALPFRLWFGGKMGSGKQIMSWIHRDEVYAIISRALNHPEMQGIYNAVAPDAIPEAEFAKTVGSTLHRPVWFNIPEKPMRWAAGEMGQLFVDGQLVVPERLMQEKYSFHFPTLQLALKDLLG